MVIRRRGQRWRACVVMALALGGGAPGCDDSGGPNADASVGAVLDAAANEGGDAGNETTLATATINKAIWYGGFKLTLGQATYGGSPGARAVTFTATFENQGADTSDFVAELVIETPGHNYVANEYAQQDAPKVPGKAMGTGTLVVPIDATPFMFQGATLIVGTAANSQARVPLDGVGPVVDLAPMPVAVSGAVTASTLKLTATAGELRFDVPSKHREISAGKVALTIPFTVLFDSDFGGGYLFNSNSLALRLPDGSLLGADDAPSELIGPRRTLLDQSVRFLIDTPPSGAYSLVLIETEEKKQGELAFIIP